MTKQEFIEYLGKRLTYEDIEKADAEAKAYVKGFIEGLDARPEPQGEWIYGEDEVAMCDGYSCNRCKFFVPWDYEHKSIDFIDDYNYCPNCGVRMVK